MTRRPQPALRRRLAAMALAVGVSGAALAGFGLAAIPSAQAAGPASVSAQPAVPADTSASSAPSTAATSAATTTAAPATSVAAPVTSAAAPSTAASSAPVASPTFGVTVSKKPTAGATPTARTTARSTARVSAVVTPRATSTYHYVAPVYSAQPVYAGNASADLPTGVGATGSPSAVQTLKPSTSAAPIYAQAQAGVVTQRRYVDVQGLSVDAVLGYIAGAGALIGLVGGLGLWLTRGVR